MKISFSLILTVISTCFASNSNYSVVFYHDGPREIPDYTKYTLAQFHLFNKSDNVYFITNHKSLKKLKQWNQKSQIKIITVDELPKSNLHMRFKYLQTKTNVGDPNWLWYCFERFFAIHSLMQSKNLSNVIHLENDCMLYIDLSEIISKLIDNYEIGITSINSNWVVLNISFFKNSEILAKLLNYTIDYWDLKITEMELFNNFKILYPDLAKSLPTKTPFIVNQQGLTTAQHYQPTMCIDIFDSIFDAARLGQYICGGYIENNEEFKPQHLEYRWIKDNKQRNIPYIVQNENGIERLIRINNLHCHKKNTHEFLSIK